MRRRAQPASGLTDHDPVDAPLATITLRRSAFASSITSASSYTTWRGAIADGSPTGALQ